MARRSHWARWRGKFWANFCRAVGKPGWIPIQTTPEAQPSLIAEVEALFKGKTAAEWADMLDDAECCFSRIAEPADLRDDPQLRAREMIGVTARGVPWMRSPVRVGADSVDLRDAPAHGEHTREILLEAGYSSTEIDDWLSRGVIHQSA